MAAPQQLIRHMLLAYPGLFPTVGHCLANIFFAIGTGLEWDANGELIQIYGLPSESEAELVEKKGQEFLEEIERYRSEYERDKARGYVGLGDVWALRSERELHDYKFTVENIDRITSSEAIGLAEFKGRMYPYSDKYSPISTMPDNVTDEWLETACNFADRLAYRFNQYNCPDPNGEEKVYVEKIPGIFRALEDKLIARGLRSTREERAALIEKIFGKMKSKGEL